MTQQHNVLRKDPPSALPPARQAQSSRIEWGQKRRSLQQNQEDETPLLSKEHWGLKSSLRTLGSFQRQAKSVRFRPSSDGSARFRPQDLTSVKAQSPSSRKLEARVQDLGLTGRRTDHEPLERLSLSSITSPPVEVEYVLEPYVSVWLGQAETPAVVPVLPEPEGEAARPHRDAGWNPAHGHDASTSHSQTLRYAINELYLCNRN